MASPSKPDETVNHGPCREPAWGIAYYITAVALVLFRPLDYYFIIIAIGNWTMGRRLRGRSAAEVVKRDRRAPVFYLRAFKDDDGEQMLYSASAERRLIRRLNRIGPVIAIGKPGEKLPPLGAARFYVPDSQWQSAAWTLMNASRLIFMAAAPTTGFHWELGAVRVLNIPKKVVLFVPFRLAISKPYRVFRTHAEQILRTPLPEDIGSKSLIVFDEEWQSSTTAPNAAKPAGPGRAGTQKISLHRFLALAALPYLNLPVFLISASLLGGHTLLAQERATAAAFAAAACFLFVWWIQQVRIHRQSEIHRLHIRFGRGMVFLQLPGLIFVISIYGGHNARGGLAFGGTILIIIGLIVIACQRFSNSSGAIGLREFDTELAAIKDRLPKEPTQTDPKAILLLERLERETLYPARFSLPFTAWAAAIAAVSVLCFHPTFFSRLLWSASGLSMLLETPSEFATGGIDAAVVLWVGVSSALSIYSKQPAKRRLQAVVFLLVVFAAVIAQLLWQG